MLVVDGANVVGSRPDGWWKDRAGAARRLHERLLVADVSYDEVVLVLEGQAKGGAPAGRDGHVRVVHAPRDGDSAVLELVRSRPEDQVTVITADRGLRAGCEVAGGQVMSPSWLLDQLDESLS